MFGDEIHALRTLLSPRCTHLLYKRLRHGSQLTQFCFSVSCMHRLIPTHLSHLRRRLLTHRQTNHILILNRVPGEKIHTLQYTGYNVSTITQLVNEGVRAL